jgi:glycosyltransferase involved in cell wall biosynthesis
MREGPDSIDGAQIFRFKRPSLPAWHPNRLRKNIAGATDAAKKWLSGRNWDTVHIHDPVLGLGAMKALGHTQRYVSTVHSPITLEQEVNWRGQGLVGRLKLLFGIPALNALERRVLQGSSAIHVLSEYTKSKLNLFHGIGDRISVIPHWCNENRKDSLGKGEARRRLGWPQEKKIFFSVRQLRPRYGIDFAIKAFSQLDAPNAYRYFIAGEGYLRPILEKFIEECGLSERICLMGRISDQDLELAYQAADIFLLPTRALECFGLIILEALSWGCPLIATDAGAIPEVLGRVLPGCTIPAGDNSAFKEKLLDAINGRLNLPAPDVLMENVKKIYGEGFVFPRIEALLTAGIQK